MDRVLALFFYMRYTLVMPQRLWPRKGRVSSAYCKVVTGLTLVVLSTTAYAGTLTPGKPTVESDRYEVPIYLNGAGNQVAALDFALVYDPAIFRPVSISPGGAAEAAGKLVTANAPEPGKYIVVMMGFNQTSVANGEVARVVLERVGASAKGETTLSVKDPSLSTADGAELPVQGGMAAVAMAVTEDKPSDATGTKPETAKPQKPATTGEGEAQSVSPRGSAPMMAAPEAEGKAATAAPAKDVHATGRPSAPSAAKAEGELPSVEAAAAKAAEERGKLADVPVAGERPAGAKTGTVAMRQNGQSAHSTDIQSASSLKIEASGSVNNNTAEPAPSSESQRAGVAAGGGLRLGLAAAVLLAVAGCAMWVLRVKIRR